MFLRTLLVCTLCATATTLPQSYAGEADGSYRVTRISTSDSLEIPQELIARAVASNNHITVRDNTITIQRNNWVDVLNHFNFVFANGTAKVSGPKSLRLAPSGDSAFTGKTSRAVTVVLTGNFLGRKIQMNLRTTCRAKINGDQMILTFPVRVTTIGEVNSSGTIRVAARR